MFINTLHKNLKFFGKYRSLLSSSSLQGGLINQRYKFPYLEKRTFHQNDKRKFKNAGLDEEPLIKIFDKQLVLKHKLKSLEFVANGREFDYLKEEIAESIVDRLLYITYDFQKTLEIGSYKGILLEKLGKLEKSAIKEYHIQNRSEKLNDMCKGVDSGKISKVDYHVFDEEGGSFPIEEKSMDMVISANMTHWVNDLPLFLSNCMQVLKEDGVFIGALFGGDTLHEIRSSFVMAEQEREGGVSPHVSPLVGIKDAGNVLTRAGFEIPTIDSDVITVYYPDAFTAMHHLQYMGENNALVEKRNFISKETMIGAASIYDQLFRTEKGVPVTFEIIYIIGWRPSPTQLKAAKRGSAQVSMKDLAKDLGTEVQELNRDDIEDEKDVEKDDKIESGTLDEDVKNY